LQQKTRHCAGADYGVPDCRAGRCFVFDSVALLSDAAHMFTDSAALAIALAAVKIGQHPPDDQ